MFADSRFVRDGTDRWKCSRNREHGNHRAERAAELMLSVDALADARG